MRPIKLEMQAFGPFKGYECVDFDALSRSGLFLITGETGAGKSTILDGITFALYGKSSGDGRNDYSAMRCRQSEWGTDTFVRFTVEINGRIYRFDRIQECKRKKISEDQNVLVLGSDGVFEPIFENCKKDNVRQKAEELIGLTAEQFRQVVILPQGQFERLLVADSAEKEAILSRIFGIDKWKKIADEFYRITSAAKEESDREREIVDGLLRAENCGSLEALGQLLTQKREELAKLERENAAADYPGQKKALDAQSVLCEQYGSLHKLEKEAAVLRAQSAEIDAAKKKLDRADRAEPIRILLGGYDEAAKAVGIRKKQLEAAQASARKAGAAAEDAQRELAAWAEGENAAAEAERTAAILGEKRNTYQNYGRLQKAASDARSRSAAAHSALAAAEAELQRRTDALAKAYASLTWAQNDRDCGMKAYMAGISGELASALRAGEPCPVCGSVHHPAPAQRAEGSISRARLDELDAQAKKAESAWKSADSARTAALERTESAKKNETECILLQTEAEAALKAAERDLVPGIDIPAKLEQRIRALSDRAKAYADGLKLRTDRKNSADAGFTAAQAAVHAAQEEADKAEESLSLAQADLAAALQASGFTSADDAKSALTDPNGRTALGNRIQDHLTRTEQNRQALSALREMLAGQAEPDSEQIKARRFALEKAEQDFIRFHTRQAGECERLTRKLEDLSARRQAYDASRSRIESDFTFSKVLRGDTGIGLQRYVLGIMFSSVISAANRMLACVHSGRYRLFRSDEKGPGNKSGLELYVHDSHSADDEVGRSVRTLSGGEKFLVSLALSIGLSDVAQRSGIRLDAMFIDEGFGTLDDHSIDDAMEVLRSVRSAHGMVGIISHVQVLCDNIAAKLVVTKGNGEEGSHIVSSVG